MDSVRADQQDNPRLCWSGYCDNCTNEASECQVCINNRDAREQTYPSLERPVFWCGQCRTNDERINCRACEGNRNFLINDMLTGAPAWDGYCPACAAADGRRHWGGCRFCNDEVAPVGLCPDCGVEGHLWKWCPGRKGATKCIFCRSRGHCVDSCCFGPDARRCHICRSKDHVEEDCPGRTGFCVTQCLRAGSALAAKDVPGAQLADGQGGCDAYSLAALD